MNIILPEKDLLAKTGEVDYYGWNYKFPIKYLQKYRFKRVAKLLKGTRYEKLLEIGTGSGIFIPELSRHCDELYAIDTHSNFGHIHELCKRYNVKSCKPSTQSIEQTDFPTDYFDAIVAVSVLEFVDDLEKALLEIKRILKPGGIFITICPMENKLLDFVLSFYSAKKPQHEFGTSRQSVTKLLEENFTVSKKGYLMPLVGRFFPVYTYYKLKK